jgi:hemerythrin
MSFMVWNDRVSVGIEVIDADHKKMLGMINELYDAILAGKGRSKLNSLFERLLDYTRYHFAHEEEMFARTGYPGAAMHKQQHEEMKKWLETAQRDYRNNFSSAPSLEVMIYLKDWLFDHILGSDQRYAPHMKAHQIR